MPVTRDLPLGRRVDTPRHYDPSVLRGIERRVARQQIGIAAPVPFLGEDVWNCYEFSWLAPTGLPRIGVLTLRVPVESPRIVESKSLKLYLNGFGGTPFENATEVVERVESDLARNTGAPLRVAIHEVDDVQPVGDFTSFGLDALSVPANRYERSPDLLVATGDRGQDAVHTHLFRTVCPITAQPDWGSVAIAYRGRLLDRASVLRYLVSYRDTADFHEVVAERLFVDLREATEASELTVDARFLRRGGIDINPFRSTSRAEAPMVRLSRQ